MYFKLCLDGISVHSQYNNMNKNVKTVGGVLTEDTDFKTYTFSILIYNWGWQLAYKSQRL